MAIDNVFVPAGAAAISLAVAIPFGFGGGSLVREATAPPPPPAVRMIVPVSLHWDPVKREMGQLLAVQGGSSDSINVKWGASLWSAGHEKKLCGGGGTTNYPVRAGIYPDDIKWMSIDVWTGDSKCLEPKSGDVAIATWEFLTESGALRSSSLEYRIP